MSTPLRLALLRRLVALTERAAPSVTDRLLRRLFLTPPRHPRSEGEKAFQAKAEAFTVPFRTGRLRAWSLGEGPIVLLLHGWGGRGGQWRHLAGDVAEVGFRAVWFDAPAHGDSPGERSSLLEFAEALCAMGKHVGPLHGVMGHSLGGAAAALALSSGLDVQRVVLVSAPAQPRRFYHALMALLHIPESTWPQHDAAFEAHVKLPWTIADVRHHLAAHQHPTLVAHDREDREVPFSEAESLATAGPHVSLFDTRGLGHRRILKDPTLLQTITDFLGAQPACGPKALESSLMDRSTRSLPSSA